MKISHGVEAIQQRVRAEKRKDRREEATGVRDMFADEMPMTPEGLDNASDIDKYWLTTLHQEPTVVDDAAFADILEATDWMPQDLQASLVRLIDAGKVKNIDATSVRSSRPLHPEESERLVLLL